MRVEFEMDSRRAKVKKQAPSPQRESLPRLTRLLALAHRWNRLVEEGTVKDYAEIARLMGLSRARVTQITGLAFLAPGIQEEILISTADLTEHALRLVIRTPDWNKQRELWQGLSQIEQ